MYIRVYLNINFATVCFKAQVMILSYGTECTSSGILGGWPLFTKNKNCVVSCCVAFRCTAISCVATNSLKCSFHKFFLACLSFLFCAVLLYECIVSCYKYAFVFFAWMLLFPGLWTGLVYMFYDLFHLRFVHWRTIAVSTDSNNLCVYLNIVFINKRSYSSTYKRKCYQNRTGIWFDKKAE